MKNLKLLIVAVIALMAVACSQNISIKPSINDNVLMGITTSSHRGLNFTYSSLLPDNKIPIYRQNKSALTNNRNYTCDQSGTLQRMLNQYLSNKYHELSTDADLKMQVTLTDFYMEHYTTSSAGIQAISILVDDDSIVNYMVSAFVTVEVSLEQDGVKVQRSFSASADASTDYDHEVAAFSDAINQANNRILMLLNAFLTENDF